MFAINHAATALLIKRQYPDVPMVWLLLAVQAMEFLWVILNFAGVERTTTEPTLRTVADIHLAYIPYSHSIFSAVVLASLAWVVWAKGLRKPVIGVAVGLGVLSHLILDLLTHDADISLAPFVPEPKIGLGLYSSLPMLAFFLETLYGVVCWRVFRGGKALLAVILLFNISNLPLYSSAIDAIGSKEMLAGHPELIVTLVAVQIIVTLALVGIYSRKNMVTVGSIPT